MTEGKRTSSNIRERAIVKTSVISILANILLVVFKAIVGFMSNSIAIVSDAVNNLSDALSSIITIVGTKLASKPADRKHPYGYGRVEHITAFIVSAIVLYAGITVLVESVKKIIEPEASNYDMTTIIILIVGIVIKFALGIFVKNRGKKYKSIALVGSGTDAFNDAIVSISVLASAIIDMIWGVSLEAYVGILVAVMILKTGIDLIRVSVDNMIGVRVDGKLTRRIKKEILKEPKVQGVFDLILNDYGPDKYLGSVHIEVPDDLTVAEIDKISRRITVDITEKFGVILHTIGIYSVNNDDKEMTNIEQKIRQMVSSHKEVIEMHGFYLDKAEKSISFDIIIDFSAKDREEIYRMIYEEIRRVFHDYKINITLDADLND